MQMIADAQKAARRRALSRTLGAVVSALGLVVLTGWLFDIGTFKTAFSGLVSMKANTALLFVLAGIGLAFQPRFDAARAGRITQICAAAVIAVSVLTLIEQFTGMDVRIDQLLVADAETPLDLHPGRMAPATAMAFLASGVVMLLTPVAHTLARATLARALAIAVFAVGAISSLGYAFGFEAFYNWQLFGWVQAYGAVALHTAAGFVALGAGLWAFGTAGLWLRGRGSEEQRITRIAAALLALSAGSAGFAGFSALQSEVESSYGQGLQVALGSRVKQITTNIALRAERSRMIVTRPSVREGLGHLIGEPGNAGYREAMREEAASFIVHGFTDIEFMLPDGTEAARVGQRVVNPTAALKLGEDGESELLWSGSIYLRNTLVIRDDAGVLGTLVTEQILPNLTATLLGDEGGVKKSIEFQLCQPAASAFLCFPTRLSAVPLTLPLHVNGPPLLAQRALAEGGTGYVVTQDYRGHRVLGAFARLDALNLIAVLKVDTSEIYLPISRRFEFAVLLVVLLTLGGTLLVHLQVRPLATALERRVRERTAAFEAANESLRASEAHLRTVVDNLSEGVAVSDLDGRLLQFNRAAVAMHGFTSPAEYLRRLPEFEDTFELSSFDGVILPLDQWPLARILRGETLHDLEIRIRRTASDWERTFSYGGTLARDADGRALMAIITIRDVTDRKRAEEDLRRSAEELRAANDDLVRFNRSFVDRELRMIELKGEINALCERGGESRRYPLDFERTPG